MSGSEAPVLYLGDTSLDTAASYLAAVMKHFGIGFDYIPSDGSASKHLRDNRYRLIILSDYPMQSFTAGQMDRIAHAVDGGTGLLMIGGWDSFQGSGGCYSGTVIEDILPVHISPTDDRVNYSFPCLVWPRAEHPVLDDLPFSAPPCIGGYNRVAAKNEAQVLLQAIRYRSRVQGSSCSFTEAGRDVLLSVGSYGRGRTAAFTSDAAPHWVGGLVDWGTERLACDIAGLEVEVGEYYARFFNNLIRWTARL